MAIIGMESATSVVSALPPEILGKLEVLITILQAVGIFFILYVCFWITTTIINIRRNKKIAQIEENTRKMNANLMRLLKKK